MNKQLLIGTMVVATIIGGVFLVGVQMILVQAPDESEPLVDTPLADVPPVDVSVPEITTDPVVASDSASFGRERYDDDEYEEEYEDDDDDDYKPPTVPTPAPTPAPTPTPSPTPTPTVSRYTLTDVAVHNTAASCWMVIRGKVYDVTKYISKHPGGNNILKGCGKDATSEFEGIRGHLKQATLNLLPGFYKGELVP